MIVIVDYGMGNIGSILNMLKKIGSRGVVSDDPEVLKQASQIILPGVGAFDSGMTNLAERGLIGILNHKALIERVPVLGVCLGMQLITDRSEEGSLPGLGWLAAETVKFKFPQNSKLKIPHMGWNTVHVEKPSVLTHNMSERARFYFVHSYHVVCRRKEDVCAVTDYGLPFSSMIASGNILGAQFHPEKSHSFGMKLLSNFVSLGAALQRQKTELSFAQPHELL